MTPAFMEIGTSSFFAYRMKPVFPQVSSYGGGILGGVEFYLEPIGFSEVCGHATKGSPKAELRQMVNPDRQPCRKHLQQGKV